MRYTIREKFFRVGEDNDINDESGAPVYRVDGKALSLRNLMLVSDMQGNEVARVHRKLVSMLPRYEIDLAGVGTAVLHRKFSVLHQTWSLTVPGQDDMQLSGNLLQHDFTVQRGPAVVATVSRAWVSLTATYGVDVAPGENDLLVLCVVLALEAEEQQERHHN
ncbi:MAG: LURP-one-related family protein [Candidatus Dormibacteraeota bacterium]|nr:LURP-one-related family protein [Candidatus Dormibacteraeota bacterium]